MACLAWAAAAGLSARPAAPPLDCILALVNDQPITLADIQILDAFGIYESEIGQVSGGRQRAILEKLIDLRMVIDLVRERVALSPESVILARGDVLARLDPGRVEREYTRLGMAPDDLLPYLEEKLIYREVVSQRFSRSTIVTLKEIEVYYRDVYKPALEQRGQKAPPVLEILDEIEARLREEKIARQIDSWIKSLRQQAEIQVFDDCLNALHKEPNGL
jgi:hypothetical protein